MPSKPDKIWMPKEPELSNEGGFLRLRNGLKEHIRKGYITSNDFAAYYTLHCFADWIKGICETTAAGGYVGRLGMQG